MSLLTKCETTQGHCQRAAGLFSQRRSFMLIRIAAQCVSADFIICSFASELTIKVKKKSMAM